MSALARADRARLDYWGSLGVSEVVGMVNKVNRDALRRAVEKSTRSSAALERRSVPAGHVRSEKAARFLAARHSV